MPASPAERRLALEEDRLLPGPPGTRKVQRYLCLRCRRGFSEQTFAVSCWLERPELLPIVFHRVLSCSSHRQIAAELAVSPSTTLRRKGTMTAHQQQRRREPETRHGRPDPQVIEQVVAALLRLVPVDGGVHVVHSDDHHADPRALRRVAERRYVHQVTSSRERRDARNPRSTR